jgi:phosphoribosylcarboxyaminoimidazole (NCAIR) mutase
MPAGIPVATMAIGKAGAVNAGVFAAQVLALWDPALARRLAAYKRQMADEVLEKSRKVAEEFSGRE